MIRHARVLGLRAGAMARPWSEAGAEEAGRGGGERGGGGAGSGGCRSDTHFVQKCYVLNLCQTPFCLNLVPNIVLQKTFFPKICFYISVFKTFKTQQ